MSRQDANAAFALTSFLYGGNASYLEETYARYQSDPNSVDAQWQAFFQSLKDQGADIKKAAEGPSWEKPNWPLTQRDDTLSALDGNWVETGKITRRQDQGEGRKAPAPIFPRRMCSRPRAIQSTRSC